MQHHPLTHHQWGKWTILYIELVAKQKSEQGKTANMMLSAKTPFIGMSVNRHSLHTGCRSRFLKSRGL